MKDKLTWEKTILTIRKQESYKDLVKYAYLEEELTLNVDRFKNSEEYIETKRIISEFKTLNPGLKLLDIGSGNGISAVSFALDHVNVDSVEPDPSETIGAGAIRQLKEHYGLSNLNVHQGFAEDLNFPDNHFDIIYVRQCMHHAANLNQFLKECYRVLKKNGLLVTIRDHVIFDKKDKDYFLENHPLHMFYGGENAFTSDEYKFAMKNAGFNVLKELKYFESVINYFPLTNLEKARRIKQYQESINGIVKGKLGIFYGISFLRKAAIWFVERKLNHPFDERPIPGRMYSYFAIKN